MNLKELKEIIDIVTSKESIEELELEKSGVRLRIKRASSHGLFSFGRIRRSGCGCGAAPPPHAALKNALKGDRRGALLHQVADRRDVLQSCFADIRGVCFGW